MRIVITGTTSGLGAALKGALEAAGHEVLGYNKEDGFNVRHWSDCEDFITYQLNELGWTSVDVLINNAGVNRIGYLEYFTASEWDEVMDTNAKGIYIMTRWLLTRLAASKGTIINITSNAAHVPMTASLAYNASKGAAEIMTRQLARELYPRHGIVVFGIAPNKLHSTGMSDYIDQRCCDVRGWTSEYARQYQLKALPLGEETDPVQLAQFVSYLLESRDNHKYFHGCIIPYGA